jgi:hypothetical protein
VLSPPYWVPHNISCKGPRRYLLTPPLDIAVAEGHFIGLHEGDAWESHPVYY